MTAVSWRHDPGPCPVDDAPHTSCTSPDYQGRRDRVVVVTRWQPALVVVVADGVPQTPPKATPRFTTAEYRGRARRERR